MNLAIQQVLRSRPYPSCFGVRLRMDVDSARDMQDDFTFWEMQRRLEQRVKAALRRRAEMQMEAMGR